MADLVRSLHTWAQAMARHYAQEIPDYARLQASLLERDVALVSYEYLRTALKGQDEDLEDLAISVGQRRQRQGISLTGLLRAYRLWAKDTLEFLQEETPQLLVEVAPRVAQILDRVSEASARGYQLSPEGTWPPGPVSGIGVALHDVGVLVYAPRYLSLSAKDMALTQTSGGQILLLRSPLKEVEEALRELAKAHTAVLWTQEGRSREEVQKDLEEALLLGPLLRMPPGLYPVRLLWPLSMALESSRGQERLMRLVKPLEEHPDLWQTLEAFLKAGLSLKRTAHRLGLHPNTVLYRIHRIEELTGLHLERVEDLCLLQIALQLREALGR
jgi:hypothetical protein